MAEQKATSLSPAPSRLDVAITEQKLTISQQPFVEVHRLHRPHLKMMIDILKDDIYHLNTETKIIGSVAMRVSRTEMAKNHDLIVEEAARLIRERGIDNTGVADVMGDAGLTHGGFYRHFETKETLILAALQAAFSQQIAALQRRFEVDAEPAKLDGYRRHYLSRNHVEHPGAGCPIAALGGDVARGSDALKAAYGEGIGRAISILASEMKGSSVKKKNRAARELAMLAGAVMIARASDPETGNAVLKACLEP